MAGCVPPDSTEVPSSDADVLVRKLFLGTRSSPEMFLPPWTSSVRIRRWTHSAACVALGSMCVYASACFSSTQPKPIVLSRTPPSPVSVSFSHIDDHSIAARLSTTRPGVTMVDLRSALDQTTTSATVNTSVESAGFVLPTPWDGELKITRSEGGKTASDSAFVGIVVKLVPAAAAGIPPQIIYGPQGRVSVRLAESGNLQPRTNIVIASPATSIPPLPPGLVGDPVEIGFIPPPPSTIPDVVGLAPWLPPPNAQLVVSRFDPTSKVWSRLRSHTARDGTVFASGPLPGVYALTVTP
jgi:hypothetical protein